MAMDFLATLAPSVASLFLGACLFSCHSEPRIENNRHKLWVNADSNKVTNHNGVIYLNNAPFTGILFQLQENRRDSVFRSTYNTGMEDGEQIRFHANGKRQLQRFYTLGKKTDTLKTFWEDGKLQASYPFVNDEYEGTCREWNQQGRLIRELHYHQGHEDGWQRQWYDNGKIRTNYLLKNGRRFGLLGTKNCVNVSVKKK
jgi:hypothetical protein